MDDPHIASPLQRLRRRTEQTAKSAPGSFGMPDRRPEARVLRKLSANTEARIHLHRELPPKVVETATPFPRCQSSLPHRGDDARRYKAPSSRAGALPA